MAITTAQKLAIKKHLGEHPNSTHLDPLIGTFEDGGALESHLTTAITACDTARTNWETAMDDADDLTEGEGAKFNHNRKIAIKKQRYVEAVNELARIIGYPMPRGGEITGFLGL